MNKPLQCKKCEGEFMVRKSDGICLECIIEDLQTKVEWLWEWANES